MKIALDNCQSRCNLGSIRSTARSYNQDFAIRIHSWCNSGQLLVPIVWMPCSHVCALLPWWTRIYPDLDLCSLRMQLESWCRKQSEMDRDLTTIGCWHAYKSPIRQDHTRFRDTSYRPVSFAPGWSELETQVQTTTAGCRLMATWPLFNLLTVCHTQFLALWPNILLGS